jgi:hypothetical protein
MATSYSNAVVLLIKVLCILARGEELEWKWPLMCGGHLLVEYVGALQCNVDRSGEALRTPSTEMSDDA